MSNSGLKYYSRILLKGSVVVTAAQAVTRVVSIIVVPIFTYYLSPEEYGTISMVMIIITVLSLLYNPGMLSATTRLYHDTDVLEERQELIGSAFRFFLFVPLVVMAIIIPIGSKIFPFIFSDLAFYPYGFLGVILAFFSQPKRIWVTLMTLEYRMKKIAILTVISILIGSSISLLLVAVFKMGALGRIYGMFPPILLYFFISFRTINTFAKGRWSIASIKRQLSMGFPLIIAIWSYEFLHIADRYILERMTNLSEVGIYSFAYQIAEMPMLLVLGVRQLWNPIFYENMNKKNYHVSSKLIMIYVVLVSAILVSVILFSKELIYCFINRRYYDAIPVIGLIVIGIFFSSLLTITNSILGYDKRFGAISRIALVASLLNIGLNILLIPYWGMWGSAFATAVSYFVYLGIGLWMGRKMVSQFSFLKIIAMPLVFIVLSYPLSLYLNSPHVNVYEIMLKLIFLVVFVISFFVSRMIKISEVKQIYYLFKTSKKK